MATPFRAQDREPFDLEAATVRLLREHGKLSRSDGHGLDAFLRKLAALIPPAHSGDAQKSFMAAWAFQVQAAHEESPWSRTVKERMAAVRESEPPAKEPLVRAPSRDDGAVLWYSSESEPEPEPEAETGPAAPVQPVASARDLTAAAKNLIPVLPEPRATAPVPPVSVPGWTPAPSRAPAVQPGLSGKVQAIRAAWPELDARIKTPVGPKPLRLCKQADLLFAAAQFDHEAETFAVLEDSYAARKAAAVAAGDRKRQLAAEVTALGSDAVVGDLPEEVLDRHFARRSLVA